MLPGEALRSRARSSLMAQLSSPLSSARPPFPATPPPPAPAQAAASSAARPGGGARRGGCLLPAQPHAVATGRRRGRHRGSGARGGAPAEARPPPAGSQPLRRPRASAVRREKAAFAFRSSPASDRYGGVTHGGGCRRLPGERLRGAHQPPGREAVRGPEAAAPRRRGGGCEGAGGGGGDRGGPAAGGGCAPVAGPKGARYAHQCLGILPGKGYPRGWPVG